MVSIEHIALWTNDIERSRQFYVTYFDAVAGAGYRNEVKGFESVFLSFTSGARIELLRTTTLSPLAMVTTRASCSTQVAIA